MYLGLWAAFGDETYLEQAKRCGKVITDGATITDGTEGRKCAWRFALDRVAPDVLSTPIGLFDGAAGIGACFCRKGAVPCDKNAGRSISGEEQTIIKRLKILYA